MTRWEKTKEALGKAVYALDCLLLAAALALAVGVLVRTVRLETFSTARIMLHRNLAAANGASVDWTKPLGEARLG